MSQERAQYAVSAAAAGPCRTEPICSLHMVAEQGAEIIGSTPQGFRVNGFISSGVVDGPRIRGKIRPAGCGDWAVIRADDVVEIDVRLTIETHDAALLYVTYTGVGLLGDGGAEKMRRGQMTSGRIPLHIAARMITAEAGYAWVNRTQFIGVGAAIFGAPFRVEYDIYALV